MDYDRLERWVSASHALASIEQFMIVPAQQLGRLDCKLLAESPSFINAGTDLERALAFQEHLTLSYLWVLGGYELVRTMAQRYHEDPKLVSDELARRTNRVKKDFERVRIPLAKFEPSRSNRGIDSAIAWPAYHAEHGVAWQLAPNVFVSRRQLADGFLELLEAVRAAG